MTDPEGPFAAAIAQLRQRFPDASPEAILASLSARPGPAARGTGSAAVGRDNQGTINTGTQIVVNYQAGAGAGLTPDQIARQVTGYLRWLRERTQCIELRGIEWGGSPVVRLPLETAYVPLRARPRPRVGEVPNGRPLSAPEGRRLAAPPSADVAAAEAGAEIALNQVLSLGNRLVIIGGPGSGKTTVLMHMAWALADSLLAQGPEPARSRLGLDLDPAALPLPILVPLAAFARHRRGLPAQAPAHARTLAHFISYHLIGKQAHFGLSPDFFVHLLEQGQDCLLLLDGLDEVPDEDGRALVRECVEDLVRGRPAMRVLVTCRPIAYRGRGAALAAGFREVLVQPLGFEAHVDPMVRQAYRCIHPADPARGEARACDLLDGIRRLEADRRARLGDRAEPLVDSPLMVRLLLIVHASNRRLPDGRAALFDQAIDALFQVSYGLEEEDKQALSTDWTHHRDLAQHLAFHMQSRGPDRGREIAEADLRQALGDRADLAPYLDGFLQGARQRGSVLEERGGRYRFIHLAFQEFLAARQLAMFVGLAGGHPAILAGLAGHLEDPWWREPILLLAGYLATKAAGTLPGFLAALAQAGATPEARFAAAELAGTAALEWREGGAPLRHACAGRIAALLAAAGALRGSSPPVRARAGDVLARLGDPRFDPERFHLPADDWLGFVPIPADPGFRIGTRSADREAVSKIVGGRVNANELNEAPTPTPFFYMARYPVTVAQFRAYLEATGGRPADPRALDDPDSRPVRYCSWREALAYCRWLSAALAKAPALAETAPARRVRSGSWRVMLPSELEWESAARGGRRDAVFPWGDRPDPNAANNAYSGIEDSSAVGCFPANNFGLHDMIGNLWEWTRSRWVATPSPWVEDYARVTDWACEDPRAKDGQARVVRGGSWGFHRDDARCACRGGFLPDLRDDDLGFRVVLRSSPVS